MKGVPYRILVFSLAIFAAAGGWYGYQKYRQLNSPSFSFTTEGVKRLPAFSLPDLEGVERHGSEWREKVLVINFWATWCPPCREEIPLLIATQTEFHKQGLQIVGIAIDELELVRDFSDVYGINFPILIGGPSAIQLSTSLGNKFGTLPFTAIFDRSGNTRYLQAGELSEHILTEEIRKLL